MLCLQHSYIDQVSFSPSNFVFTGSCLNSSQIKSIFLFPQLPSAPSSKLFGKEYNSEGRNNLDCCHSCFFVNFCHSGLSGILPQISTNTNLFLQKCSAFCQILTRGALAGTQVHRRGVRGGSIHGNQLYCRCSDILQSSQPEGENRTVT